MTSLPYRCVAETCFLICSLLGQLCYVPPTLETAKRKWTGSRLGMLMWRKGCGSWAGIKEERTGRQEVHSE